MSRGENLIFVFSQPRAGSTLLQKVLGAHPAVCTVSEPWIALHPLFGLRSHGIRADYDAGLAAAATREFLRPLPEGEQAYWDAVGRMLAHLYQRQLEQSGKCIFLDKTPRYYFVIEELRKLFPDAHFVFLLRNPLAVLASMLMSWVRSEDPLQLRNLRHDMVAAPGLLLDGIRREGARAIVVRYEEMVDRPAEVIRGLADRLGLDFLPQMIEYGAAGTAEKWTFGDQGTVYRESRPQASYADGWRRVFHSSPVWAGWARAYLDALGAPLLSQMGYDYADLARELPLEPATTDWRIATSADSEQAALAAQLHRLHATLAEQNKRASAFEQAAQERLRELLRKEAMINDLATQAEQRREALLRATHEINERDARIAILEKAAQERLTAMLERDEVIARLDAALRERSELAQEAGAGG